jgi:hypothetical protein
MAQILFFYSYRVSFDKEKCLDDFCPAKDNVVSKMHAYTFTYAASMLFPSNVLKYLYRSQINVAILAEIGCKRVSSNIFPCHPSFNILKPSIKDKITEQKNWCKS